MRKTVQLVGYSHVCVSRCTVHSMCITMHGSQYVYHDARFTECKKQRFLISNFHRVLSIVCNLLGISLASDY